MNSAIRALIVVSAVAWGALSGCDASKRGGRENVVRLGITMNAYNECIGHAMHECGPEHQEIQNMLRAAFASHSICKGLRLTDLTTAERQVPAKDIPNLLEVLYVGPEQWQFQLFKQHRAIISTVRSEADVVETVCRIVKSQGGQLD